MKRENWQTLTVKKQGWPVESWTFKRCAGQNLIWMLFGNDRDGVTPWFQDKQWTFWAWWFRNRWSNLKWYGIGYAWWVEGDHYAAWNTDHLEYHWFTRKYLVASLLKPKHRCFLFWRPYIWIRFWRFAGWIGWKRRGQWAFAVKKI